MVDLGTPSKSNEVQNDTPNLQSGANGAKTAKIQTAWRPQNAFLEQPCARAANWSALGHIFHDFEEFWILSSREHQSLANIPPSALGRIEIARSARDSARGVLERERDIYIHIYI